MAFDGTCERGGGGQRAPQGIEESPPAPAAGLCGCAMGYYGLVDGGP
jgi:hypothetical protein